MVPKSVARVFAGYLSPGRFHHLPRPLEYVGGNLTMGKTSSQEEPLVVSGHFNYSREPKDRFWGYLYALFLAFTVIGGIVTIKSR